MNIVCVWTGGKYPVDYVYRLRSMVQRHLPHEHEFTCVSNQPVTEPFVQRARERGITWADYSQLKPPFAVDGWWAKLLLFNPFIRQGQYSRCVYLDLDTVICGDITPLMNVRTAFGICANFTAARGVTTWPCRYGSCVMAFGQNWGGEVWDKLRKRPQIIKQNARFGDQMVIEKLIPDATLLQDVLPKGFFLHYKDLKSHPTAGASIVVFGGRTTPENCGVKWVQDHWK